MEVLQVIAVKIALLRADKSGATAIEYALIAGGIAIAIIGAVQLLGVNVSGAFNDASAGF